MNTSRSAKTNDMSSMPAQTPLYVRLCRGLTRRPASETKSRMEKTESMKKKSWVQVVLEHGWGSFTVLGLKNWRLVGEGHDLRGMWRSTGIAGVRKSRGRRRCLQQQSLWKTSSVGCAGEDLLRQPAPLWTSRGIPDRGRSFKSRLSSPNRFFSSCLQSSSLDLPYTASRGSDSLHRLQTHRSLLRHGQP